MAGESQPERSGKPNRRALRKLAENLITGMLGVYKLTTPGCKESEPVGEPSHNMLAPNPAPLLLSDLDKLDIAQLRDSPDLNPDDIVWLMHGGTNGEDR